MTDLEATKLCAEAMQFNWVGGIEQFVRGDGRQFRYDPLHNDAQAMALVKRFKLFCNCDEQGVWLVQQFGEDDGAHESMEPDLNRAIVYCVAQMREATISNRRP